LTTRRALAIVPTSNDHQGAHVRRLLSLTLVTAAAGLAAATAPGATAAPRQATLPAINHIVVIYEENHSFDNLYGRWEGTNGRQKLPPSHTIQVNQAGVPFQCLLQNDVNLTAPPLSVTCSDTTTATAFTSHFANWPFRIDTYLPPRARSCPPGNVFAPNGVPIGQGLPGGCTRDMVHRFYQEQYQLNGGQQNRYVTGSDAVGLVMGHYDTKHLPIYKYLHQAGHPDYAISDAFFQAAFGGSFLNHQWLVAAANPVWTGALNDASADDLHSVVDPNGMPTSYPLYASPLGTAAKDAALTASCTPPVGRPPTPAGVLCGDYAVNTIQPTYQPFAPGTAAARQLPPQTNPTIGDRLSAAGVDWAWYSGGWSNADGDVGAPGWTNGTGPLPPNANSTAPCPDANANVRAVWPNCPDNLFQFHHQALNYYASFAPGTAARAAHLRDEVDFMDAARSSSATCNLKPVSIVKPIGAENEHPGYASEHHGSSHLVDLIDSVVKSACKGDTMIVVTYDEFGGQWDHVSPPGQGGTPGPHDVFGPGTRIPALTIAPGLSAPFVVDHAQHDTTSIAATIEHRFGLAPLATRDAAVADLSTVFSAAKGH
jgi:phospholipase C